MSKYYNSQRTRNMYSKDAPFKISRSKIEDFMKCKRCFWLDRVKGISQPPGYPFTLNVAVDALLKKEFDQYREAQEPHPLMTKHGLKMVPFKHEKMEEFRNNFKGVLYHHEPTNLIISGAVDDLWETTGKKKEVVVSDYKATSKTSEISLEAEWQMGYKRQMEMYQWLLRQNGFKVSDTGYFVYANGLTTPERFDSRLEFEIHLLPYTGDSSWVEPMLFEIKACLEGPMPECSPECDFCAYNDARNGH